MALSCSGQWGHPVPRSLWALGPSTGPCWLPNPGPIVFLSSSFLESGIPHPCAGAHGYLRMAHGRPMYFQHSAPSLLTHRSIHSCTGQVRTFRLLMTWLHRWLSFNGFWMNQQGNKHLGIQYLHIFNATTLYLMLKANVEHTDFKIRQNHIQRRAWYIILPYNLSFIINGYFIKTQISISKGKYSKFSKEW